MECAFENRGALVLRDRTNPFWDSNRRLQTFTLEEKADLMLAGRGTR